MALLQNVIAIGTHAARPAAGSAGVLYFETDTKTLLRDNGSTWDVLIAPPSVLLDYTATSDLASGLSLAADTWTSFDSSHSFTVAAGGSGLVAVSVRCGAAVRAASPSGSAGRILIDGTTGYLVGSSGDEWHNADGGSTIWGGNPFTGTSPVYIAGLSAGAHTVQVQAKHRGSSAQLICRPSAVPDTEFLSIQVVQLP